MALPASEDFAGAAGALGGDFTQLNSTDLERDGNGHGIAGGTSVDTIAAWNADTPDDDQYSELTVQDLNSSEWAQAAVRLSGSSGNFAGYAAYDDGTANDQGFVRWENGGPTFLGSGGGGVSSAGDVLRCEAEGTTIRRLTNGSVEDSITDSTHSSGTVGPSIYQDSLNGSPITAWEGGNLGGGGGPTRSGQLVSEETVASLVKNPLVA